MDVDAMADVIIFSVNYFDDFGCSDYVTAMNSIDENDLG